jgi:hypothetical protein
MSWFWIIFSGIVVAICLYGILKTKLPEPTIANTEPPIVLGPPPAEWRIAPASIGKWHVERLAGSYYPNHHIYRPIADLSRSGHRWQEFTEREAEEYIAKQIQREADEHQKELDTIAWQNANPRRDIPPYKLIK